MTIARRKPPTMAQQDYQDRARALGVEVRPVPGLPETYAASDGRIFSTRKDGFRPLSLFDNGRGYLRALVWGKHRLVHGLVCGAFHGPRPPGLEVNHKDGDKYNNRPENLEYVTRAQNVQHSFDSGLRESYKREAHPYAKLTEVKAAELRAEYWSLAVNDRLPRGEGKRMAEKYGVCAEYLRLVATGRYWG